MKREDLLLTANEWDAEIEKVRQDPMRELYLNRGHSEEAQPELCLAQARKLMDKLGEPCPHLESVAPRRRASCPLCFYEIREALK